MDQFNLEIISPEKSFLTKSDTEEVVIPAIEGYMGILKDHIPLISFLKPGIIDVRSKNETLNYYVDDGIVEFKDNTLSILTSNIFDPLYSSLFNTKFLLGEPSSLNLQSKNKNSPNPVLSILFKNCFGIIISVSIFTIGR